MVPVNPKTNEVEGRACFAQLQDVSPPVDGALLMTLPNETEQVVLDCLTAGVRRVWMHRGGGDGAVSPRAAQLCKESGVRLVEGFCPFMFLPKAEFYHRVHGIFLKVTGRYPVAIAAR